MNLPKVVAQMKFSTLIVNRRGLYLTFSFQFEDYLLFQDKSRSLANCIMSTAKEPRLWLQDPAAVCRLSTYARRSKACVKYQEHFKQIEGLTATGEKAVKCTLQCKDAQRGDCRWLNMEGYWLRLYKQFILISPYHSKLKGAMTLTVFFFHIVFN